MALTDFAHIYAALHDSGINRMIKLLMKQRPSLFNYGTAHIRNNPELLCEPLNVHPDVTRFLTVLDPVPVIGSQSLGLDYCVQLTDFKFDFFPSSTFPLPGELSPLGAQHLALKVTACAGLGCIPKRILDSIRPFRPVGRFGTLRSTDKQRKRIPAHFSDPGEIRKGLSYQISPEGHKQLKAPYGRIPHDGIYTRPEIQVIPPEKLECFCLSVYAVCTVRFIGSAPNQSLVLDMENIEIEDISPRGMENAIECYSRLILERTVLPQVLPAISELLFSPVSLGTAGELLFSASTSAAHNPAVEDNQLKLHVNLDEINIVLPDPGEEESEPWPDPDFRYQKTRSRTDAFDLTTAVREDTLREVFGIVGNQFTWSDYDTGDFGPFSASYGVAVSVHDSDLELRADHQMTIGFNLNVDELYVNFGIDIPEISIPGFCLVPPGAPQSWCAVWIPGTTLFGANPDIHLPLDISGILSAAVTLTAVPVVYYGEGAPNRWMLFIDPDPSLTSLEIEGLADIPGTLLENAIDAAIASLDLPGWAEDVIETVLGPLVDVIKGILGVAGDVSLWLINFIGNTLGLWDLLKAALLDYVGNTVPLFQLPDPLPVMPADPPEIEVRVPVTFLKAVVNDTELILQADIGGSV